jgi:hypothetical protein
MFVGAFFQQKGQGFLYSLLTIQRTQVVVLCGDAQGAQAEAGGGDAGHSAQGSPDNRRPVAHQAAPGAGFVKEEIAIPAQHVVQEGIGHLGDLGERPVDEDAGRMGVLFCCLAFRFGGSGTSGGRLGRAILKAVGDSQTRSSPRERSGSARLAQKLPAG